MSAFSVARSITIHAPRDVVHANVDDLRAHEGWSPWQSLDPHMRQQYSGPAAGEGAAMWWEGNRKAGSGSQRIVTSTPNRVEVEVQFRKPFKSKSVSQFNIQPAGEETLVTWTMRGQNRPLSTLVMKVLRMEQAIGRDFEKGLMNLKAVCEAD